MSDSEEHTGIALGSMAVASSEYSVALGANTNVISTAPNTWGSGSTGFTWEPPYPVSVAAPEHPEYENKNGDTFEAEQLVSDPEELARVAKWVGAKVFPTSGLRVPTLEGVQALFIGDWVVKDSDGIVYLYDNTDFANEFRRVV